ncbi:wD repeat domain [Desmophyllum pertusum]|uniref:WD repeat domain n=1 Tax=Desmophyllum pertusum TaxID=174260 RepID=A0A9W9Z2B0_9CNID|nr:wD repeat domain [Desmophyllum pertusum]
MLEKHRHLLLKFRQEIVEDLLVDDVLAFLRSKFVFDSDDTEVIRAEQTSRRQAEKLLDMLPEKGYETFEHLFTALSEKYPHLARLLESGSNEEKYNDVLEGIDSPLQLELMTAEHVDILTVNRVEIVEDLLVDDVLNFLQSKMVFDIDDSELIRAERTSRRQAEKLLDLLETKSDAAFYYFRESLEEPYPHLVELLQEDAKKPRKISDAKDLLERVENVLREGGVPQRPAVFANRARDVHKIRTALRSLQEKDGWVILHGMAGCGKTVLATEALRSALLLDECFPGGVHWIRIGPVDQSKLLMRMQNLCVRLDPDHSRQPPRNTEEAKDRLRMLFAHQYPRSLLVLDDLWDSSDVKFFDIRCRIMVTTRDAAIRTWLVDQKLKFASARASQKMNHCKFSLSGQASQWFIFLAKQQKYFILQTALP